MDRTLPWKQPAIKLLQLAKVDWSVRPAASLELVCHREDIKTVQVHCNLIMRFASVGLHHRPQTWRAHVSCSLTAILNLNGIVMPNDIPPVDAMSDELHLFCSICLSIFLPDTPPEAEAVATPCGHVYHRDCIERIIHVQPQPQCHICSAALPVPTALLKLFIVLEESDYDKEIQDAVRRATGFNDHTLDAVVAEAECRDKIQALRQEQEYNVEMLAALEAEWSAIEKINVTAEARLREVEGKLGEVQNEVRDLEVQLGHA
ncbi:hypothetical protein VTO73DRAFT_14445 [Trametes versicolor]